MQTVDIFSLWDTNAAGSWASIISLFATLFTAIVLWSVKKKFLFRSGIDGHFKRIASISSELSSMLGAFSENKRNIDELFALADVELRAMQRGAEGDLLVDVRKSRRMIKKYRSTAYFWVRADEDFARKIKTTLSVVAAEIPHHKRSLVVGN